MRDPSAPPAWLYRVLDAERPSAPSARWRLADLDSVLLGRADQRVSVRTEAGGSKLLHIGVADRWVSSRHALLTPRAGRWVLDDQQSKNGVRRNGQTVTQAVLEDGDVLEVGRTFFVFRSHDAPADELETEGGKGAVELRTLSVPLSTQLRAVASSNRPYLLRVPPSMDASVVARALHGGGPFISVSCGALPDDATALLGDSERPGFFRAAEGGTLALAGIDGLSSSAQAQVAAFLRDAKRTRVLAWALEPLEVLVATNQFRADLARTLLASTLDVPPLADRREDLGLLVRAVLEGHAPQRLFQLLFTVPAARALFLYDWPNGLRELEKSLESALLLTDDATIELEHLPAAVRHEPPGSGADEDVEAIALERRLELETLLESHRGNLSTVARAMKVSRVEVQRWVQKLKLDPADYR